MIKLVYVITRRADMSSEQFHDYWLNTHGPKVASVAKAIRARKYVQSHLLDHPANEGMRAVRGMLPPVDGITEVWWDSLDDFNAAYATPEGIAADAILAEDEGKFIDFAKSQVFMTHENLIFDHSHGKGLGPDALKVTYLLSARKDLTRAACHKTWLHDHGPLVASFAEPLLMQKYIQSHTVEGGQNPAVRQGVTMAPPLDGITEVWIDSLEDLGRSGETEAGRKAGAALAEDERRFVEMGNSHCFLTREHLIFDHTH